MFEDIADAKTSAGDMSSLVAYGNISQMLAAKTESAEYQYEGMRINDISNWFTRV